MKRRELLQALACAPLAPSAAQAAAQDESRTHAQRVRQCHHGAAMGGPAAGSSSCDITIKVATDRAGAQLRRSGRGQRRWSMEN